MLAPLSAEIILSLNVLGEGYICQPCMKWVVAGFKIYARNLESEVLANMTKT